MIKCNKCGNETKFAEIHVGGYRIHSWTQEENGRWVFDGSDYNKVDDTVFECSKCGANMNSQYKKFLQALYEPYNENKHGL